MLSSETWVIERDLVWRAASRARQALRAFNEVRCRYYRKRSEHSFSIRYSAAARKIWGRAIYAAEREERGARVPGVLSAPGDKEAFITSPLHLIECQSVSIG